MKKRFCKSGGPMTGLLACVLFLCVASSAVPSLFAMSVAKSEINASALNDHVLSDGVTLLRGQGTYAYIMEADFPFIHDDFYDAVGQSRLSILNPECGTQDITRMITNHATGVSGIILGNGSLNPDATGLAPEAMGGLVAQGYQNVDAVTKCLIQNHGIDVQSTSAGTPPTIAGTCFMDYGSDNLVWDSLIYDTETVLVLSAGNVGSDKTGANMCEGGFLSLTRQARGKNSIAAGLARTLEHSNNMLNSGLDYSRYCGYEPPGVGSFVIFDLSSQGPTIDGRIKPDIAVPGGVANVTYQDNSYGSFGGTSYAAPMISGLSLLLIQKYDDAYSERPRASMVKALLLGTAVDQANLGPDYWFGWGIPDGQAPVDLMDADNVTGGAFIRNVTVSDIAPSQDYLFYVGNETDFKVTGVWTDPPGPLGAGRALVNDVDLMLIDPVGNKYFPWVMPYAVSCGPANDTCDEELLPDHATRAVLGPLDAVPDEVYNRTDNVEQVAVALDEPVVGVWTLRVDFHNPAVDAEQTVSLVASRSMFAPQPGAIADSECFPAKAANYIEVPTDYPVEIQVSCDTPEGCLSLSYEPISYPAGAVLEGDSLGAAIQYDPADPNAALNNPLDALINLSVPGEYKFQVTVKDRRASAPGQLNNPLYNSNDTEFTIVVTETHAPRAQGASCCDDWVCGSGHCVDGVCCDATCDGPCETCGGDEDGSGMIEMYEEDLVGVCTPYLPDLDPEDECDGATCNGAGECNETPGTDSDTETPDTDSGDAELVGSGGGGCSCSIVNSSVFSAPSTVAEWLFSLLGTG